MPAQVITLPDVKHESKSGDHHAHLIDSVSSISGALPKITIKYNIHILNEHGYRLQHLTK